jgi:hypothetical protein
LRRFLTLSLVGIIAGFGLVAPPPVAATDNTPMVEIEVPTKVCKGVAYLVSYNIIAAYPRTASDIYITYDNNGTDEHQENYSTNVRTTTSHVWPLPSSALKPTFTLKVRATFSNYDPELFATREIEVVECSRYVPPPVIERRRDDVLPDAAQVEIYVTKEDYQPQMAVIHWGDGTIYNQNVPARLTCSEYAPDGSCETWADSGATFSALVYHIYPISGKATATTPVQYEHTWAPIVTVEMPDAVSMSSPAFIYHRC